MGNGVEGPAADAITAHRMREPRAIAFRLIVGRRWAETGKGLVRPRCARYRVGIGNGRSRSSIEGRIQPCWDNGSKLNLIVCRCEA